MSKNRNRGLESFTWTELIKGLTVKETVGIVLGFVSISSALCGLGWSINDWQTTRARSDSEDAMRIAKSEMVGLQEKLASYERKFSSLAENSAKDNSRIIGFEAKDAIQRNWYLYSLAEARHESASTSLQTLSSTAPSGDKDLFKRLEEKQAQVNRAHDELAKAGKRLLDTVSAWDSKNEERYKMEIIDVTKQVDGGVVVKFRVDDTNIVIPKVVPELFATAKWEEEVEEEEE